MQNEKQEMQLHLLFELVKKVFLTSSQTRTAGLGSRLKRLHPAARIICALIAHKFTLAGRFVFCPMYTPPDKTDSHFIRACGRELYEVF